MLAHYTCYGCGDSWCCELIDLEVQAYIEEHPELAERILAGEINSVDLGEVLCDGCEDEYYQEKSALDAAWDEYDDLDAEDDTDGDYKSWLCGNCGDPVYDCGCDDDQALDLEDEIDRKADLMKHGRL